MTNISVITRSSEKTALVGKGSYRNFNIQDNLHVKASKNRNVPKYLSTLPPEGEHGDRRKK